MAMNGAWVVAGCLGTRAGAFSLHSSSSKTFDVRPDSGNGITCCDLLLQVEGG